MLLLVLLAPVLPILDLSPFSHAYVNRLTLRKARDEDHKGNPRGNRELLQLLPKHKREFVNAGNSADAISTYHDVNGIDLYDYAHNYHPDHAQGVPRFGYTLVNEWYENRSKYPEHHVAIAAGRLAHQLADWYPPYACIRDNGELDDDPTRVADGLSTFAGFANALTIFGADLPAAQALANVQDAIKCWLESAKEHGKGIPPPADHTEPEFSGKFTLRVPRTLHGMLAKRAESEGVSLNQYLVSLISFGLGKEFGERSAQARETHASEARLQASYSIASEDRPSPAYRTSPSARSRTSAT